MKKPPSPVWLLHPVEFALYPVLGLVAANLDRMAVGDAGRSLLGAIALSLVILLLCRLLLRSWDQAALVASLCVVLFFTYGHVYRVIKGMQILGFVIGRHRYLLLLCLVLLAAWIWAIRFRLRDLERWNRIFSLTGLVAVALPVAAVVAQEWETARALARVGEQQATDQVVLPSPSLGQRDLYYIILDGYGRADVLAELYDLDNSAFTGFLRDRGFYVAQSSRSNYIQTALSLASSLNMEYVNDLAALLGEDSTNRKPLNQRIYQNRVMGILRQAGYQLVSFNSGIEATSIADVDYRFPSEGNPYFRASMPGTWLLNPFEGLLLETTAFSGLFDLLQQFRGNYLERLVDPQYQVQRERIRYTLDKLSEIPELDGPLFVFAHIVAPHPPFVFGPDGEARNPQAPFAYHDGSDFFQEVGTRAEYIAGYRDQLLYLNTLLEQTIAAIIEKSEPQPIILLQSDHGPGAYLDWHSMADSDLHERFSILNAYYLPGAAEAALYPSISPVNSFRLIFSAYLELDYPLLEDRSYFSSNTRPYRFEIVE